MLEFALMLPFLLLLVVGIVDIGRAIYFTIAVNNGAAAGAEFASQGRNSAGRTDQIKQTAVCDAANGDTRQHLWNACSNGLLTTDHVTVTLGCRCADDTGGLSCDPMPSSTCGSSLICDPGVSTIECVRVQTTATFSTLFNWPGLPSSYTANGNAVTRVRN
jgi:TadE-like protein